jgi:hypothetical protein
VVGGDGGLQLFVGELAGGEEELEAGCVDLPEHAGALGVE